MTLILETERLRMRPLEESDLPDIASLYGNAEVMKYIHDPIPPEQVELLWPKIIARGAWGKIGTWCLEDRTSGQFLGDMVLMPLSIDEPQPAWDQVIWDQIPKGDVEIGYELMPHAWGKGYATEAAIRLLGFAFDDLGLSEVVAVTDPENHASMHVLEKCGLKREGERRAYGSDGCPAFRILKSNWDIKSS